MDLVAWAFFAFIAAAVLFGTALHYRRREPAGRGRYVLAGFRWAALALLVLLVFDPAFPTWGDGGTAPTIALVDASLSMRLPAPDGTTRWDEARRSIAELGPDAILVFGSGAAIQVRSLDDSTPDQPVTRLGPALRSVLETGAARVVVVTDGAVEDVEEANRIARAASGRVEAIRVGERSAGNAGIVEIDGPDWARADEEVGIRVAVAGIGEGLPDSVTVTLRWADRELAQARLATPPRGRVSPTTLRFTPPPDMGGTVRLDAVLEEADAEPADDRRSTYIVIAEQPAGVVLVSFTPGQEPRFLLPVLERALGMPTTGWLALGPGRFVRVGVGPDAGRADTEAEVRGAVAAADLIVLHGFGADAPEWARSAAATARRVVLFASDPAVGLPVEPGPARPGDWYVDEDVPGSPVAPFLAGVSVDMVPPLTSIRVTAERAGWWAPLHARQGRRGEPRPVLVAGRVGDRRVAVALADGYWRWAFHEGDGRALYDALWSGLGTWLLGDASSRTADAVRPEARVVPRSQPVRWVVPPATDSVRVTLHPLTEHPGSAASTPGGLLDTVMVAMTGSAVQTPPAPGHYRYEARAMTATGEAVEGAGELTVERYSDEFTRPASDLELAGGVAGPRAGVDARSSRPLRTMAWPYLVVVVLLCAEWVLRRRWGLR